MQAFSWILCAMLSGAAPDPDLLAAQNAYNEGRYQDVLPLLKRALDRPLGAREQRQAYELKAMTHAAFDDSPAAVESFRHALGVDPTYEAGPVSPKIRALLEEARRRGPLGTKPDLSTVAPPPAPDAFAATEPPAATSSPAGITSRWWFWAGVAVVLAAAGGTAAFVLTRPTVPSGNLGVGAMQ